MSGEWWWSEAALGCCWLAKVSWGGGSSIAGEEGREVMEGMGVSGAFTSSSIFTSATESVMTKEREGGRAKGDMDAS